MVNPEQLRPDDESEKNISENQKRAENILILFASVLEDVEKDERVDLDKPSDTHKSQSPTLKWRDGKWEFGEPITTEAWSKKQALEVTLKNFRKYIDYLPKELKQEAERLMMKAEIYIADHKSKTKNKK